MVDSLLKDIGIDGANLSKMGGVMNEAASINRMQYEQQRMLDSKKKANRESNNKGDNTENPEAQK